MPSQLLRTASRNGKTTLIGFRSQLGSVLSERVSRAVKCPCGTIWPNGEFGIGYAPRKEESDKFAPDRAGGVSLGALRREAERAALDLTSLPNSHKPSNRPETYGRKGLSGYGAKFVRNAGHVLQQEYGKSRLTFLTLTLPPMTGEAARAVASTWAETMRQLVQWISRQLLRKGLPTAVCGVTELQTKRLQAQDSACLHAHLVFVGRHRRGAWVLSPKKVRAWWLKRLSSVTNGTVHSMNCVDMKAVKKDAGNYLSKYMSKGAEDIEAFAEAVGWDAVPRQWWNVNKVMRSQVKTRCLKSGRIMQLLDACVGLWYAGEADDGFKFVRAIEVEATKYQSFVVGFWGRLSAAGLADLTDLAMCAKST